MNARNALLLGLLPLACLGVLRLVERVDTFVVEPSRVQARLLGRIVAPPWELKRADVWIGTSDGLSEWIYARPGGYRGAANSGCRARIVALWPGQKGAAGLGCELPPGRRLPKGLEESVALSGDEMQLMVSTRPAGQR